MLPVDHHASRPRTVHYRWLWINLYEFYELPAVVHMMVSCYLPKLKTRCCSLASQKSEERHSTFEFTLTTTLNAACNFTFTMDSLPHLHRTYHLLAGGYRAIKHLLVEPILKECAFYGYKNASIGRKKYRKARSDKQGVLGRS